ncbi:hypothetical protein J0895_07085 [Phormidium pseudopriestleyi FRX01]|uniref:Uncharacterized protein n=1 Tax=Phormidium pseudopriestleyi FRX01 TaxID=1759528 RepID=A0ABS3FQG8_9CYAN|nr:hypothetical protein [Phormidium pseudopriestleyi]MBO0348866.1 hypothetical protein [Phormidium pseudopriestleyi FRX01]
MKSFWKIFNREQHLPTLNVAMLGARGVGKTSLLAAMYDQFENVSKDLQLVADAGTKSVLDKRLKELKSLEGNNIKFRSPLLGGNDLRTFKFEFGETGTAPSLEINFYDYPGGWLIDPTHLAKVQDLIYQSAAVLIPIDTPALMEKGGKYHEDLNHPTEINDVFKKVYKDLDSPRLVILTPVKCEKYIKNNPSELFTRVKQGYRKLLNQFDSNNLASKVAVVIIPVQTIGSVELSYIEDDKTHNEPIFYFWKLQADSMYQPKNTEVPLRYLLRFLLKLHLDNKPSSILTRIQHFLANNTGKNTNLRNAVSRFADPKSDDVEIVQGSEFLKL